MSYQKHKIDTGVYQTIGHRNVQQDSVSVSKWNNETQSAYLGILADGMGGMKNGEKFSQDAIKHVVQSFEQNQTLYEQKSMYLAQALLDTNKALQALQTDDEQGGTTLVLALIIDEKLWFASVGDSYLFLCRRKKILQLNRLHHLGTLMDERACIGVMNWEDAANNGFRHALNSFVGDEILKWIDLIESPIQLLSGDSLILMSDGVIDALDPHEVAAMIDTTVSAQHSCERIIQAVESKKCSMQDNASIVIMNFLNR